MGGDRQRRRCICLRGAAGPSCAPPSLRSWQREVHRPARYRRDSNRLQQEDNIDQDAPPLFSQDDEFVADLDRSIEELDALATTSTVPWKFQGHDIHVEVSRPATKRRSDTVANKLPVVVLVHGFGCSTFYWRKTVAALTKAGYEVVALDLLGQGMSAKPSREEGVEYSTNLWAKQLDDFCRENLQDDDAVVLIGNSIGSIVSLIAASGDFANEDESSDACFIKVRIAGIGMFNCGIGMNVHSITRDPKWSPLQRYVLDSIFDFVESAIFSNVALMRWVLGLVTRDVLRNTLLQLYPCAGNPGEIVDDELVESFYVPAKDPKSPKVLSQILTNDAGLTPMEVHAKHDAFLSKLPIHVVWGDADTVTPVDGIGEVGQLYTALASEDGNRVTMDVMHGGHILFDEVPGANRSMVRWLDAEIVAKRMPLYFCSDA
ncbi:hypothetical protein ACHAXT_001518 [Thalassiosira profunda]